MKQTCWKWTKLFENIYKNQNINTASDELDSILAKTAENVLVGHFRTSPANWYQICIRNQSLNVSYSLVSLYTVLGGKYAVLVVTIPAMQVLLIAKQFLMRHSASYCSLLVLLQ